jgi:nicotinamide-nucleotide amidase
MERGVVCYSNRAKTELLGVAESLIEAHGAVSEEVASAMAHSVRERARADIGVAITGIAGPDGGTPAKPVGTVCVAVVIDGKRSAEPDSWVRTFPFLGGRELVKFQSTQAAMNMVRLMLLGRATE